VEVTVKFVIKHKEYEGCYWEAIKRTHGAQASIRYWWEIENDKGNIVAKSVITYPTEIEALASIADIKDLVNTVKNV
jgi:hypothetical protein